MRRPYIILCTLLLAGCASAWKPPQISYDDLEPATLQADPPNPVEIVEVPKPLPLPGQLKPLPGKTSAAPEAKDPKQRVAKANDAARVQPTRHGYLNAVQGLSPLPTARCTKSMRRRARSPTLRCRQASNSWARVRLRPATRCAG